MSRPTILDAFNERIANNRAIALLVVLGTIVIAVSTFTDAAKNLLALASRDTRPAINGTWTADVVYDWDNAKYVETLVFNGDGNDVYGTASFLRAPVGILEARIDGDRLEFITKTQQTMGSSEPRDSIHRYRGIVGTDEIRFVMQTEGGYTRHVPIEFTARRTAATP